MTGGLNFLTAASLSVYMVLAPGRVLVRPRMTPIPDEFFGMHLINGTNSLVTFRGLRTTGVSWPRVEPGKGTFDWSRLDGQVQSALASGWKVLYTTDGVPPWAAANPGTCVLGSCSSAVNRLEDWDAFVTALVQRYRGRIEAYELWNEPDQNFTGSMAQFVVMAEHFRAAIRLGDPAALVVAPGVVKVDWHGSFWDAGGTKDVDAVAFHGYLPAPFPEELYATKIGPLETILATHGMSSKPIWDSESSWGEPGNLTDPQAQASYVARAYLLQWSSGLRRFYWYSEDDTSADGTAGWGSLVDSKLNRLAPAGIAYQQVRGWMLGATMTIPCADTADGTWTCSLVRPGYRAMAVWNLTTTKEFKPRTPFTRYRDLAGNVIPVRGAVTIGKQPILLENSVSVQ